jgi:hypothetical protein
MSVLYFNSFSSNGAVLIKAPHACVRGLLMRSWASHTHKKKNTKKGLCLPQFFFFFCDL